MLLLKYLAKSIYGNVPWVYIRGSYKILDDPMSKYCEKSEQQMFREMVRMHYPWLSMTSNGNFKSKSQAYFACDMGYLSGIPDVMIIHPRWPFFGLYIEFKNPKVKLPEHQSTVAKLLREQGYAVIKCGYAREAMAWLDNYMTLPAWELSKEASLRKLRFYLDKP